MRYFFAVGIISGLMALPFNVNAEGNLLTNSGFEEIKNIGRADTTVPGWTVKGRVKAVVRQDSAEDMFGNKSLKIYSLEFPKKGNWEIYQEIPASRFKKNKKYRFTGWMKNYKGGGAFQIYLLKDGKVIKNIFLDTESKGRGQTGSGCWLKYTTTFTPENCDKIRVACAVKNDPKFLNDTTWFDGLELASADYVKIDPLANGPFPPQIYVDAKASSDGDGSKRKPFKLIQTALDKAGAGTTIFLQPGIYTESFCFRRGGSKDAPLVLKGGPDVHIQAAGAISLKWTPVPAWGNGVYKTASPTGFIRGIYVNKKRSQDGLKLPLIRYERAGDDQRKKDDVYHYRNIFRDGIMTEQKRPGQGFDVLQAVAMYNPEDKNIYIRFGDNTNPNKLKFRLVKGTQLIDLDGIKNVIIENLKLRCSVKGIGVRRSENIIIRNCSFTTVEYGVKVKFSSEVKVANCVLTLNAYHAMMPQSQSISTPNGLRYQADVWRAFKWVGYYDRCGIIISECRNCEVFSNYIHDHWDGISVGGQKGPGIKVHHNYIANICDDGFTIYGDTGQEWYGNTIINAFACLRYWNNPHNKGPLYIYGNRFIHGRQDNIRFMQDTNMEIYIYHNTTIGGDGIRYHGVTSFGTPNTYVYNNHFLGDFYGRTSAVRRAKTIPNFKAGYNTYLTDPLRAIAETGKNGHNFQGVNNIAKGVDLSSFFGKPLPGCEPGYFKGKAPDCGANALNTH